MLIEPTIYSVAEFLDLVNTSLTENIGEALISGEISDLRFSKGQWVSFSLKDDSSILNCFGHISKAGVGIEEGMLIKVLGKPKVYPKFGKFSFVITAIEPLGTGSIKRAYELLLKKLESEGLFSTEFKQIPPRFPERIGLITSADGAALGDVRKVLEERWGNFTLFLAPVSVQGAEAVPDVIRAIDHFNLRNPVDLIILTRGGGSLEDLQAFNDERVARTIFASRIPIIAAIGHERDVTIAELAADIRAATPSNAAQLAVPDRNQIKLELQDCYLRIKKYVEEKILNYQHFLENSRASLKLPIIDAKNHLKNLETVLRALNPESILARGYSLTMDEHGKIVSGHKDIKIGTKIITKLSKGLIKSEVFYVDKK